MFQRSWVLPCYAVIRDTVCSVKLEADLAQGLVIVGAGQAAFSTASKLRSLKDNRPITIVGVEAHAPYQRPPLSKKYLLGEMSFERLLLRPEQWYTDNNVELHSSTWVEEIDRGAKQLILQNGSTLAYDQLVLATGATPRRLPQDIGGDLSGVFTVRNKDDADRLREEMKPGLRLLIIGGGYIGLEAAAVARHLGLEVTLIEMAERILARVAAKETADFIRASHIGHGVMIREGMGLSRLIGEDGRVVAAELSDGSRLDVDLVIVGIGVTPNDGLAARAGLSVRNGILVDSFARTSDSDIFAVGDCALQPWQGEEIRLESVQNAVDQGEAVAAILAGSHQPYQPKPWFWSDQYDLKLQIAGLNLGYDDTILRPGAREGSVSIWYFREGKFIAVDAINDARAYVAGKKLLELGKTPEKAVIRDAQTDLKQLLL
jgi:3-phenylpropionate/trans-cinnamate dioxygenase ferredoxin reductase component